MCGIAGIYDLQDEHKVELECLQSMIQQIQHRGPDGTGVKLFSTVGLAHARLSIIDLETGDQPIHNEDQSVWTVFNGEIFNFIELREILVNKGHIFSTQSDTEVIVHMYEEYGDDFVNHLNGQFAIALYDSGNNRLLLIRDRIGIVPLFYTQHDSKLFFASEIKALLAASTIPPELNYDALDQIFSFWSPISPGTMFKDIFEVSPGQMLIIENGKINKRQYWDWEFPQNGEYLTASDDELAKELKEILIDATKIRLRSDVPVGAYLSGGLDSSTIVSIINNYSNNALRTFSIGFEDEGFDESSHQDTFIKKYKTNHSYLKCANSDISNEFVNTIWHTELPILRTAPVPMKMLSKLVKDNNYKVVLTGEGADEVLGGYDIFKEAKIRRFWAKNPDSKFRSALLKRLYPYLDMAQGAYLKAFFGQGLDNPEHFSFSHLTRWSSTSKCKEFFSEKTRKKISTNAFDEMSKTLPKEFGAWHSFNQAQYIEAKSLMSGYLLCSQGDRMLMSNSVEGRFPFLDHRLIEFANMLYPKTKMRALNEKFLLKKTMRTDLPESIVGRHKQPYRAPNIPAFFNEKTNDYVRDLLSSKKLIEYGYFDENKVERLIKKIEKGRAIGNKDNMALTGILSTQVWHHLFVENFNANFKN